MSHLDSALGLANLAPLLTADLLVLRRVPSTSYQFSKDLLNEWIVFWESRNRGKEPAAHRAPRDAPPCPSSRGSDDAAVA